MARRRIVFMGSPDFAIPALDRLAASHEILAVYTQPPRRSGRGMRETPQPLAAHAAGMGIEVHCRDVGLEDPSITAKKHVVVAESTVDSDFRSSEGSDEDSVQSDGALSNRSLPGAFAKPSCDPNCESRRDRQVGGTTSVTN